jgi:uncharacterized protein YcnI
MKGNQQMRWSVVLAVSVTGVLLPAGPAAAHVGIEPATAAPGQFGTYTLTVPNERPDQDTVALDVTVPAGFQLAEAESVPGWQTVIDTRSDGTVSAVHWRNGHLPPHTFAQFRLRGRTGNAAGRLAFNAAQHYERELEEWTGAPDSEHPAPTIIVATAAANAPAPSTTAAANPHAPSATADSAATAPSAVVQVAPAQAGTVAGTDSLARSRASLALMLALTALLAVSTLLGLTVLRRRVAGEDESARGGSSAPATAPPAGTGRAKKKRQPVA